MGRRWNQEEFGYFHHMRNDRIPAVYEASRRFQQAAGIAPGTRAVGNTFGTLWTLPELPIERPQEIVARVKRKMGLPPNNAVINGARTMGEASHILTKGSDASLRADPQSSNLFHVHKSPIKVPKIVIDLADNPDGTVKPQRQPWILGAITVDKLPPASPPPNWLANPFIPERGPAFWVHTLSSHLNRWIHEETSKSSQVNLSQIEFRSVRDHGHPHTYLNIDAKYFAKSKLIHLAIAPAAARDSPPDQPLDWIVLEVDYPVDTWRNPYAAYNFPYWVIAFPLDAVTEYQIERRPLQASPSPTPAHPQHRKTPQKMENEFIYTSTIVMGKKGKAPLVHGRYVSDKSFFKDFIEACMEGRAVIELESMDALPFA